MVKRVSCRFNVDNAVFGNLVMNYTKVIYSFTANKWRANLSITLVNIIAIKINS